MHAYVVRCSEATSQLTTQGDDVNTGTTSGGRSRLDTCPGDIASDEQLRQSSRDTELQSGIIYDPFATRIRDGEVAAIAFVYLEIVRGKGGATGYHRVLLTYEREGRSGPHTWKIASSRFDNDFWLTRMRHYVIDGFDHRFRTRVLTSPHNSKSFADGIKRNADRSFWQHKIIDWVHTLDQ